MFHETDWSAELRSSGSRTEITPLEKRFINEVGKSECVPTDQCFGPLLPTDSSVKRFFEDGADGREIQALPGLKMHN